MKSSAKCLAAVVLMFGMCFDSGADDLREKYFQRWCTVAVEQMAASGVPASITLAQASLESGNGTSRLAVEANNHFGIKCHGWKGAIFHHDDDRKNECFRNYSDAGQSFSDHSDFLRYNDRYSFLFDLEPTDYKGWAHGLKKAGYATDPAYAEKLIRIIEEYGLHKYDLPAQAAGEGPVVLPLPPSALEQSREIDPPLHFRPRSLGTVDMYYTFYEKHGIIYIIATGTETYASLARQFNLFKGELLRFNEEKKDHTIAAGEVVYLQAKRNQSTKDLAKHVVEEGESMRSISQRFAVKMSRLYKYNNLKPGCEPQVGSIINLRKDK